VKARVHIRSDRYPVSEINQGNSISQVITQDWRITEKEGAV